MFSAANIESKWYLLENDVKLCMYFIWFSAETMLVYEFRRRRTWKLLTSLETVQLAWSLAFLFNGPFSSTVDGSTFSCNIW